MLKDCKIESIQEMLRLLINEYEDRSTKLPEKRFRSLIHALNVLSNMVKTHTLEQRLEELEDIMSKIKGS